MEDCLEVGKFLHHSLIGIDLGSLKDNVEFFENVFEDSGIGHEGVELPG